MNGRALAVPTLVVVAVLAACSPTGDEPTTNQVPDTPAPDSPVAQLEPPTEEPEAEPEPEPAPEPEPTEHPDPIEYSGSGDTILDIDKPDPSGVGVATITHDGSSNFAVRTVETSDLLVNVIGSYTGRVLFDILEGEHTERLEITADGSWTVTTEPLVALTRFDHSLDGRGDDVVVYTGDSGVATITHGGESNFAIWAYYPSGRDLLVNEIGSYSGQQLLDDAALLQISADGDWPSKWSRFTQPYRADIPLSLCRPVLVDPTGGHHPSSSGTAIDTAWHGRARDCHDLQAPLLA